jgi:hypothetical protein
MKKTPPLPGPPGAVQSRKSQADAGRAFRGNISGIIPGNARGNVAGNTARNTK